MTTWVIIIGAAIIIFGVIAEINRIEQEKKEESEEIVRVLKSPEEKLEDHSILYEDADKAVAEITFDIVGMRYRGYRARRAAQELGDGDELFLEEEPKNRYDRNAIKVTTLDNVCLGYVPREEAALIKPFIAYIVNCTAYIVGFEYYPEITVKVEFRQPFANDREALKSDFYKYYYPHNEGEPTETETQKESEEENKVAFIDTREKYKYATGLIQERKFDKALPLLMDCLNESYLIQAVPLKICQCYSVLHQKAMLEMFVNSIIDEEWITEYSRNKMKDYVRYCK